MCNTGGCRKQYRVIKFFDEIDDDDVDNLFIEEVTEEVHDHAAGCGRHYSQGIVTAAKGNRPSMRYEKARHA